MRRLIFTVLLLIAGLASKAQLYSNDFENQYTWYPPWSNLRIIADSTALEGSFVCVCDSTMEYGLGYAVEAGNLYPRQNINIKYEFLFRTENSTPHAVIAFSIDDETGNKYWNSYSLASFVNDTAVWSRMHLDLNFPADYIGNGKIRTFIWNREKENLWFDNASITITPWEMPSYLDIHGEAAPRRGNTLLAQGNALGALGTPDAMGMLTEYIIDGDTLSEYHPFVEAGDNCWMAVSGIDTTYIGFLHRNNSLIITPLSTFHKDCRLLRQALVVPFNDSTMTIYRRNMAIDTALFQPEYYLDREGFKIGEGDHTVISYHQTEISSTQFDAVNRTAYFNIDYWRDHPMIHYPLNDTVIDYYEDISCQHVYEGLQWDHAITLYEGNDIPNLPRIMSIPYGYESGIIFTEHADWTDIRTHRAVLFGSEKVTKARDAIGGFVYYGIPVTKSVFYNNPDQVTNEAISRGTFKGLHTTIKTDKEFNNLLKQLYRLDFDICLHTPEQHTTTSSNLEEALRYMKRHFKSTTWIDHGYNNGLSNNREDMICDGLDRQSEYYAAHQWQRHGIKYLWNAYYEENRMNPWCFDNNLTQPYPGFGDALPNRQVTILVENGELKTENSPFSVFSSPFYTWCTPSTLEAVTDNDWDFYYSDKRLQRLVDNHDVHITHIYPAWVWPGRTFWTYDSDSTIVALPGMNRAFERIANLRDEHKMLPMTIKTYLDYYTGLLHVQYEIIDGEHIRLHNLGDEVKGFTLLCPSPIRFDDNRYYDFRKSGGSYYVWFDLEANDEVTIKIVP